MVILRQPPTKMGDKQDNSQEQGPHGTATHSGWNHFYVLFSKYRDECIKLGQVVFGTNPETSLRFIVNYHSSLYSMAQQVFSFYDSSVEEATTKEWFEISSEINKIMNLVSDKDFKNQMIMDGQEFIPKELKIKLIMFFNRIDRLAAEAGLLVGKENKELNEPKKGLMGFRK